MKLFRTTFGLRALAVFVGLCALLCWAVRYSRDSRPPYLYARWVSDGDDWRRLQAAQELGELSGKPEVIVPALTGALTRDPVAAVRKQSAISLGRYFHTWWSGYDVRFISVVPGVTAPPIARTRCVLIGQAGSALHFRILDEDGAMVVNVDERQVIGRAQQLAVLKKRLPTYRNKRPEQVPVLRDVAAAVGDAPWRGAVDTAVPALVSALEDQSPSVRAAAAAALGEICPEPEAVVSALLRAAHDENDKVRGEAIGALGLIEGAAAENRDDVRSAVAAAMNDGDTGVREKGIYAFLAVAGEAPAFAAALLKDRDVAIRRLTVAALDRSSPVAKLVVTELGEALSDPDEQVRHSAAGILSNIGARVPRTAVP